MHLATELVQMAPYADDEGDEDKARSWQLPGVPAALAKELEGYVVHRTSPLNRARDGTACMDIVRAATSHLRPSTACPACACASPSPFRRPLAPFGARQTVGNDKATTLRFLGYLAAEKEITPGLGVFCRKELSEWVEDWLNALGAKGLKFSTLANYCNALCMVGQYVYSTYEVDADALAVPTLDELLRLRGQCESQAKQQALYSRRDPCWIDFADAQKARVKAEAAYRAPGTLAKKKQALKEWVILALHTCAPPDRVGVLRRLRLGTTLKRSSGDGFVLDLTTARSHKTSRFQCAPPIRRSVLPLSRSA